MPFLMDRYKKKSLFLDLFQVLSVLNTFNNIILNTSSQFSSLNLLLSIHYYEPSLEVVHKLKSSIIIEKLQKRTGLIWLLYDEKKISKLKQ